MQVKEVKVALKVGDGSTDNGLAEGEFEDVVRNIVGNVLRFLGNFWYDSY